MLSPNKTEIKTLKYLPIVASGIVKLPDLS